MGFGKETETIEFKKTTSELDEGIVSISSILNKHNHGVLYFGIANDGTVVGQQMGEDTLRKISQKIRNFIRPVPSYTIEQYVSNTRNIIEVKFNGTNTPYSAFGKYYIRNADEDNLMPRDELQKLFRRDDEIRIKWESESSELTLDDVNEEQLKHYYSEGRKVKRLAEDYTSKEEALTKLNLLTNNKLNNAGKYLFSKSKPILLKLAVFASTEKITFLDIEQFHGNIFECIERAIEYISSKINWAVEITSISRIDIAEIPIDAIREIVINSFAHADYHHIISNHEICIFPDRVTVFNPGQISSEIDLKKFENGKSKSVLVNPTIANTLYKVGIIEAFGTGLKKVFASLNDSHVKYTYEEAFQGFEFEFARKSQNTFEPSENPLNKTQEVVLKLLEKESLTINEISKQIGKSPRTIADALKYLKENNYIKRSGPIKSGKWIVIKK